MKADFTKVSDVHVENMAYFQSLAANWNGKSTALQVPTGHAWSKAEIFRYILNFFNNEMDFMIMDPKEASSLIGAAEFLVFDDDAALCFNNILKQIMDSNFEKALALPFELFYLKYNNATSRTWIHDWICKIMTEPVFNHKAKLMVEYEAWISIRDAHYLVLDREQIAYTEEQSKLPSSSDTAPETFLFWMKRQAKELDPKQERTKEIQAYIDNIHLQEGWEFYEIERPEKDYQLWLEKRIAHYNMEQTLDHKYGTIHPDRTVENYMDKTTDEYEEWMMKELDSIIKILVNTRDERIKSIKFMKEKIETIKIKVDCLIAIPENDKTPIEIKAINEYNSCIVRFNGNLSVLNEELNSSILQLQTARDFPDDFVDRVEWEIRRAEAQS